MAEHSCVDKAKTYLFEPEKDIVPEPEVPYTFIVAEPP
jgi:hypothetical protein